MIVEGFIVLYVNPGSYPRQINPDIFPCQAMLIQHGLEERILNKTGQEIDGAIIRIF
ncbi:hypothetical protein D3C81_2239530 [compost metagenome]